MILQRNLEICRSQKWNESRNSWIHWDCCISGMVSFLFSGNYFCVGMRCWEFLCSGPLVYLPVLLSRVRPKLRKWQGLYWATSLVFLLKTILKGKVFVLYRVSLWTKKSCFLFAIKTGFSWAQASSPIAHPHVCTDSLLPFLWLCGLGLSELQ